ncbi:SpoIIE family protein phosphatase [Maribellus maritimus]|uniref:SpoIIE family protein phosphatase n=1 Tax=Maribellus maritimus TaxID=2870838 RepID=UPI001EEB7ED8|nr:SpoIIE family protein phosphatase [Maribellus maritimus]MCG6188271.1 SpoIIE family protein phosphatase [Maribellus maritimus]
MEINRDHILYLQIDNESDVGVCRRKAVGLAKKIGFDDIKTGEVAIMVTELVTNVLKHGGRKGKILVCQLENEKRQKAIEIWCCDMGNGIADFNQSVTDGYTQQNSLGLGLGTIRRFSDELDINPKSVQQLYDSGLSDLKNYKHCIRLLKWVPTKHWIGTNKNIITGAASRAKPGEKLNGDSYVVNHLNQTETVVAVIDGLGHGKEANIASQMAKEQILLRPELPLDALIQHVHNGIRGTRGAVIGLVFADTQKNKLRFTGIGNIEGFLNTSSGKKNLISFGGIVGHNMRTPRIFEFDFNPGDILCLTTDGITSRWNPDDLNWKDHPQQPAEYILRNFSRQNDDATVLILRYNI